MSLLPEKRKCPKCGKIYSFNPDVGKIFCPNCKNDPPQMEIRPSVRVSVGPIDLPDFTDKQ
ncbi:MAG: hypothetical protein KBS39_02175 [Lachnospiraceae bacterium]|nr:hypothetical protein [Candidatus Hippenecus merdae]